MGSEEVLIQDGEVSVKGQPVPDGKPRLLHGEGSFPLLGYSAHSLGQAVRLGRSCCDPQVLLGNLKVKGQEGISLARSTSVCLQL